MPAQSDHVDPLTRGESFTLGESMSGTTSRTHVHVLTPGDHFSPDTGSAVPTVIDGLARAGEDGSSPSVAVVATGTYQNRYDSATVVEYEAGSHPGRARSLLDVAVGRLGRGRPAMRREWSAALQSQHLWAPSVVFAHNGVQLLPSVDHDRHRTVLYAHNELFQSYSRPEISRTLDGTTLIVAVSDFLAGRLSDGLSSDLKSRLRVVPNGVDCNQFRPRPDPARQDNLQVLYVGRTIPQKGPDVLLRAVSRLSGERITVRVVGSHGFDPAAPLSSYEQSLRRASAAMAGVVQYVPTVARTEVPELIRSADVLIVPSRWPEPFGLTVLEGMASGIPVIASAVGGIPQAMGGAGIQVDPDDPEVLAEAIHLLATDESARRRIGEECRRHALAHDWHFARSLLDGHIADTA